MDLLKASIFFNVFIRFSGANELNYGELKKAGRMSWARYFARVRTWLPEPRVLHPYPDARFRANHSR